MADLTEPTRAPYIREQFRSSHLIDDRDPEDIIEWIMKVSSGRQVDPDILTVVTKTSLCELLGITGTQFNGWKEHAYGAGRPPEGRWFSDRGKPGSGIMWYFERDIMPWLTQTEIGRSALRRMITDIQAGRLYPVFDKTRTYKRLRGYALEPQPETWPQVGRRRKDATVAAV